MLKWKSLLPVFLLIFSAGCGNPHLIENKEYRLLVEEGFDERKKTAFKRNKELFGILEEKLTRQESEALKFLYAFMPLSDLADYDGSFFLANVKAALRAREISPWGKSIPEEIFLHYVLPCRVNNENLDSFRIAWQDELFDRIKGITDMGEAALEINHWCHEKVTYQPSDSRTSSPMYTILSARGRCGEESTLAVAALRLAGIPARQVYTPRWAHTDDNHAWVEIWINGKWHYMGACEPEPVLDRGWFTEPARRAMLIHTKSFGAPYGDENYINRHRFYAEVNNLADYAPVKRIFVKVSDKEGNPVSNAVVEYLLYNYAEFYPLATVPSDTNGISSFETGFGDLLVWASRNNEYDYRKFPVTEADTVELILAHNTLNKDQEFFDLVPPVSKIPYHSPPADLMEDNKRRLLEEDKIRMSYADTWIKPEESIKFAAETGYDTDVIKDLLGKSMGNYKAIFSFLQNIAGTDKRELAVRLLMTLSDKDLRDTREDILNDHLFNVKISENYPFTSEIFAEYVLNPRVANEMLAEWRSYLQRSLPEMLISSAPDNPEIIADYVRRNITVNNEENYYKTPITPGGVHQLGISDEISRDIYFVAVCRALGIPSRLEPGTSVPQYYFNHEWNDVYFSEDKRPSGSKGYVRLVSDGSMPVPEYYTHFTIARFESGRYYTLEYEYNKKITDFREDLQLAPGRYMIVTGIRTDNDKVLAGISFFDLDEGQELQVEVTLRKDIPPPEIYGNVDLKIITGFINAGKTIEDVITDKGTVIAWVEYEREPTKHFLNDISMLKKEFDNWGGYFVLLSVSRSQQPQNALSNLVQLPLRSILGNDHDLDLLEQLKAGLPAVNNSFPLIILTDKHGDLLFKSEGYRIGTGEQILRKIY